VSHAATITAEVRALERLDLEGLREEWRRRYGLPPKARSPELIRLSLAWRIQAEAFDGLDVVTRRRLRQSPGAPARPDHLGVGAKITREWRGVLHEVDRVADGFRWREQTYASLSAVAQAITGVKWNGPKFFGLREKEQVP
jgi:hypothetical protein